MKIVILNQKGGVGKSTITVNLGYGLAHAGKKTLIIDLDPQAHSTVIYSSEIPKDKTVSNLFLDKNPSVSNVVREAVIIRDVDGEDKPVQMENLFIIPSNIHLAASSESIISRIHREKILHNHLARIEDRFDFILIDCPPTLGVLTINAVYTGDLILIPTNYSKYSLDGISDLFDVVSEVKQRKDYQYKILRNLKDIRSKRTNEVIEEQLKRFEDNLFDTIIRRSEAINQAQMMNLPIYVFEPKSTGSEDFDSLSKEILNG
jgi:chromosome partitioning protein